jgi:PAS domain S-box-containing protein
MIQFENQMYKEFNKIVLKLARDFINLPINKLEEAIENALKMIGGYSGADRITIYLYDWGKKVMSLRNEWVREPQYHIEEKYKVVPFALMTPYILKKHLVGQHYTASINNNDPLNLNYFTDIRKTGAQVATSLPFIADGMLLGTCVLSKMEEKKEWDELTISSITVFCEMLTSVLQRIESKEKLIENNINMRLLLDSTNDAIVMLDLNGFILDVNKSFAARFKTTTKKMIGKYWLDFVPEQVYGGLVKSRCLHFDEVIKKKQLVVFEDIRDGLTFYNRFYPILKDGEIKAVTLFSTDITDKMKAIEHAKKTTEYETRMRIQTDFFTNISHEFKTPLSIILAELELMQLYPQDNEKMVKYIKAAKQNSYRLTRLVQNFLDISKLDAGYLKANMHYADMVSIIKEITDSVWDYAFAKSISLQFRTKLLGYYMAVDRYITERIMLNLLSNAIKFTPKGGSITVSVKGKDNNVLITVSDNGEGIPKQKLRQIFDRFIQVDTSFARKTEGTGIGLSITKLLVELLGGKISVKSNLGKGSAFFVELPVLELEDKDKLESIESYAIQERVQVEFSDIYVEHSMEII